MKSLNKILIWIVVLLAFNTCEKSDPTNPFDSETPKSIWTPTNFTATQNDKSVNLTWSQKETNISGFKIDRKVGDQDWSNVTSTNKTAVSWTDNNLTGGQVHQYKLYAYAGDNQSNTVSVELTPVFNANLSTSLPSNVTCSGVTLGGNITDNGGATVTERGVVYSTTSNPTISNTKITITGNENSFSWNITGLAEETKYYARAYAINSAGKAYGNEVSFTTTKCVSPAIVSTGTTSNLTCFGVVILGGNVTSDGGATVTERGVVYSTSPNPTVSNTKVQTGKGTGIFNTVITGLAGETKYYARAYAINSAGKAYGNEISFTTDKCVGLATVGTNNPSNIGCNQATLGGNVTNDGGATVTERGVVYSTSPNPTVSNTKVQIGNGTGNFNAVLIGLAVNTTYHVRAYAINSAGTTYGSDLYFTTPGLASVATATHTNLFPTSVTLGGNVTNDGGTTVTERGVVYSTFSNPTTSNTKVEVGSGTGTFNTSVTGLNSRQKYYARAYAINCAGISYGNTVSFTMPLETLSIKDSRDGKTYKTVKIGDQWWMAENLAYLPSINHSTDRSTTSPKYYVYDYGTNPLIKISVFTAKTTENYKNYGVLYNWLAAKAACLKGWHLPTDAEWEQLAKYISNDNGGYGKTDDDWLGVGKHLKSKTGWKDNGNGIDDYQFSGLPGGYLNGDDKYYSIDYAGFWWSATILSPTAAWFRVLGYESAVLKHINTGKDLGLSVRCVRD